MTTIRKWPNISKILTADASTSGVVEVDSISDLYLFQKISIKSNLRPELKNLQIIEFISTTKVRIAEFSAENKRLITDLSVYLLADNASINAPEQKMTNKDYRDIIQETFERFPIDAYRIVPVNKEGKLNSTEDPMHVQLSDGNINIGTVNAEIEVQLSHQDNVPDAGDIHDSVRIGGGGAGETVDAPNEAGRVRLATLNQKELPSQRPVKYVILPFENEGSSDMTVDGSGTPVIFLLGPAAGEIWFVERVTLLSKDSGNLDLNEFGSGPALSNGLRIEVQSNNVAINDFVFKNNQELINTSDMFLEIDQFTGASLLMYQFIFKETITLFGDQGDFVRFTVQDNLNGLQVLNTSLKKYEVI